MVLTEADIAGVRSRLEQAIASFAARGWQGVVIQQMEETARLLEQLQEQARREPPAARLAPALRELDERAAHLGRLFDSAATFYRGWLGVSPALGGDYTAEGVWAAPPPSIMATGLSFEA